jgi:hypothetical protein
VEDARPGYRGGSREELEVRGAPPEMVEQMMTGFSVADPSMIG